ncbi:MAG: BlaI/MecI/CopY family transcriptional regulator [Acidobacteria bacterium]|nr:BlaI/MecI/CopY family transcriptional regulator [Acidobacteriota bacterium]
MSRTQQQSQPRLTDAELRLMDIIWKLAPVPVQGVVDALPADLNLAYSTVLTTMRILEEKGFLTHTKEGRAFVYSPVVERKDASRSALREVLDRFFGSKPELLVQNMIDEGDITTNELAKLKMLIAAAEKETR